MTRPARRWLLAVVATLATTVLAVVDGAAAIAQEGPSGPADVGIAVAPNPAVGNVSAKMLKAMQRDLKVTAEQAKARLVQADWASRLDPPLRQRLGKTYAGSWLAKDGQEFVVAITDRSKEAMVRASGATPRLVARSEAELSAIGARLDTHATKTKRVPERVAGWVVDPQTNQVRVEVLPGGRADAAAFVSAAGLSPRDVEYETVRQRPQPNADIKGGEPMYVARTGELIPTHVCSVGFAVTDSQRRPGYLTVAHCFPPGATRTLTPTRHNDPPFVHQGTLVDYFFGGTHDEAFVRTTSADRPVPYVRGFGLDLPVGGDGSDIPVSDDVPQIVGSPVCKSGRTTLLTCGEIIPGSHSVPFPNGAVVTGLVGSTACGENGDSGGAVISGQHAQGIHQGSRFDCSVGNRLLGVSRAFYVPLRTALTALNVTLKVRPTPTPSPTPVPSKKWTSGGTFWDELGGAVKGRVASVSLSPGHVQIFGRGTDDRLYTNTQTDGVWSGWQGLGDALTEPPTALARAGGVVEVFYRGVDTRPYVRRWNGSAWEAPVKLGDIDVEGPIAAVSLYGGAHAALFIRSSNDEVYFAGHNGTKWSNWVGLGGDVNAAPTAIARPNANGIEVLEVYARWADDNVRYRRLNPDQSGFQPWVNLGGIWKDATPVGVTVGVDHSFLLGIARDNTLHFQQFRNGEWLHDADGRIDRGWRGVGGSVYSQPSAIAGPGERLRVFARAADQQINMITWGGGDIHNWERWVGLDGDTGVPVEVSRRNIDGPVGVIDAFGVDAATLQPFHTVIDAAPQAAQVAVNQTAAHVGDLAYYTVSGVPGAPVSWSSTKDGVPVEDHAFHGQYLDGNGTLTVYAGQWAGSDTGSWVKQVHVGTETVQTGQVAVTVSPRPVAVYTDKAQYQVGDNITYAVTGPPNEPILWTSTVNGIPTGESNAYYGYHTDANGWAMVTRPWTDTRSGTWIKQVTVGGQSAQTTFEVLGPPPPPSTDGWVTLTAVHSGKCLAVKKRFNRRQHASGAGLLQRQSQSEMAI